MPMQVKAADTLEWLLRLRHDTERYYQDHLYTLELIWSEATRKSVAKTVCEQLGAIPPGTILEGMVIPSSDQETLYVRVSSNLKGPDAQNIRFIAHQLPLADISPELKEPVLQGVLNRIGWAFLKRIWAQLDAKTTHYELSRRHMSTLTRRANIRTLIRFVVELIEREVTPYVNDYFYHMEIFSLFTDQLMAMLITAEYSDELRELKTLPKKLFGKMELAYKAEERGCASG